MASQTPRYKDAPTGRIFAWSPTTGEWHDTESMYGAVIFKMELVHAEGITEYTERFACWNPHDYRQGYAAGQQAGSSAPGGHNNEDELAMVRQEARLLQDAYNNLLLSQRSQHPGSQQARVPGGGSGTASGGPSFAGGYQSDRARTPFNVPSHQSMPDPHGHGSYGQQSYGQGRQSPLNHQRYGPGPAAAPPQYHGDDPRGGFDGFDLYAGQRISRTGSAASGYYDGRPSRGNPGNQRFPPPGGPYHMY